MDIPKYLALLGAIWLPLKMFAKDEFLEIIFHSSGTRMCTLKGYIANTFLKIHNTTHMQSSFKIIEGFGLEAFILLTVTYYYCK